MSEIPTISFKGTRTSGPSGINFSGGIPDLHKFNQNILVNTDNYTLRLQSCTGSKCGAPNVNCNIANEQFCWSISDGKNAFITLGQYHPVTNISGFTIVFDKSNSNCSGEHITLGIVDTSNRCGSNRCLCCSPKGLLDITPIYCSNSQFNPVTLEVENLPLGLRIRHCDIGCYPYAPELEYARLNGDTVGVDGMFGSFGQFYIDTCNYSYLPFGSTLPDELVLEIKRKCSDYISITKLKVPCIFKKDNIIVEISGLDDINYDGTFGPYNFNSGLSCENHTEVETHHTWITTGLSNFNGTWIFPIEHNSGKHWIYSEFGNYNDNNDFYITGCTDEGNSLLAIEVGTVTTTHYSNSWYVTYFDNEFDPCTNICPVVGGRQIHSTVFTYKAYITPYGPSLVLESAMCYYDDDLLGTSSSEPCDSRRTTGSYSLLCPNVTGNILTPDPCINPRTLNVAVFNDGLKCPSKEGEVFYNAINYSCNSSAWKPLNFNEIFIPRPYTYRVTLV
jgi:hypothetical protein